MNQKNRNTIKSFSPKMIRKMFWLAVAAFALAIFVKLTWELKEDNVVNSLDSRILAAVVQLRHAQLNGPAVDITALGSPTVITIASAIAAVFFYLSADNAATAQIVIAVIGSAAWMTIIKRIVARPRPPLVSRLVEVSGYSYPSGHSIGITTLLLTLAILTCRHYKKILARVTIFTMAVAIIALVAFSRVYLGAHYPSDITSGILLGTAWSFLLGGWFSSRYWQK